MILAAIDIGSNAARLLISEAAPYQNGSVDYTKLCLLRIPLRLGFDVFRMGSIGAEKKSRLVETMEAYRHLMNVYKVERWRVCATSAMRDAANSKEIVAEVKARTGLEIEVISGQEEANVVYETHIAENLSYSKSYLYIDVGGGSTELTLFSQNKIVFKESFNIGTIRLLHDKVNDDQWDYLKWYIKTQVKEYQPIEAIGSGGNINKIMTLSRKKEGKSLSIELLKEFHKEFSGMTVEERMHKYHFRDDRADVIVPALQIFINVMRWADAEHINVPKIGVADGLIRMLYKESLSNLAI